MFFLRLLFCKCCCCCCFFSADDWYVFGLNPFLVLMNGYLFYRSPSPSSFSFSSLYFGTSFLLCSAAFYSSLPAHSFYFGCNWYRFHLQIVKLNVILKFEALWALDEVTCVVLFQEVAWIFKQIYDSDGNGKFEANHHVKLSNI